MKKEVILQQQSPAPIFYKSLITVSIILIHSTDHLKVAEFTATIQ